MQTAPLKPARSIRHSSPVPELGERASEVDVLSMVGTAWRGKWVILLTTLCALALAGFYLYRAEPLYTAMAVVSLQNRNENVAELDSVISELGSDRASLNTEIEVLRSRSLAGKLVDRLDLMSDPEFNPYIRPVDPWSLTYWRSELRNLIRGPGPQGAMPARTVRDETINQVLKAVTVANVRDSYVFEITATTASPTKSAQIADTLADVYILDQLEVKFDATEKATEWLSDRVGQLKVELEAAENELKAFSSGSNLISVEALDGLNRQLKEFRDRRADLLARQEQAEARVAALEAARESGDVQRMIEAAEFANGDLLRFAPGDSPADSDNFRAAFDSILERARREQERARSQIPVFDNQIAELEARVASQSGDLVQLQQLEREVEATRALYEHFLGRLKETSVQQGIQRPDSRVISDAVVPLEPSWPRKTLIVLAAVLLGGAIGTAIVLLREMRNNAFRTSEQLEQETGVVVMGQIPRAPSGRRRRILDFVASKPASALVEAIRNLRTSILLSNVDRPAQVIMLTSSVPGEGKTTLSLALAHNLGSMGKKVLVIEGDLRRRAFREVFDSEGKRGVVAAVTESAPLNEVVHQDRNLGFDVLFGERLKINAADFFSSDQFDRFLQRAREEYDYVVIDTPPVLVVPDARVVGQIADVVVYVVHWDQTPRVQVQQGLHSFALVNVPVTGLVLSQVDPRGMRRYGYGSSYGYAYGYYGKAKKYYEA